MGPQRRQDLRGFVVDGKGGMREARLWWTTCWDLLSVALQGRPEWPPDESSKVLNENVMLYKMVWLWLCAETAHGDQAEGAAGHQVGFCFCMEYPEDPRNYMTEGEHRSRCVSAWRTEFMKEFTKETNLSKCQFEQGALGHMFRRPTCCLSNLGLGIQGLKDQRTYVAADTKDTDQSVWPHGFREPRGSEEGHDEEGVRRVEGSRRARALALQT